MRPSELRRSGESNVEQKQKLLPVSSLADPPVSQEEARAAGVAICRWHNGLVKDWPFGVKDGTVFLCPKGKQYWRFSKKGSNYLKPLSYSRKGIV
jgi:hypothetical protein